jgi:hypothetical protein
MATSHGGDVSSRWGKVLLVALCAVPALGFNARTPDGYVASFYFACPEYKLPARVRIMSYSKERFEPRTDWPIRQFERGMPPQRAFQVLGEVEVLARGHKTTLADLREKATKAAEKMGGDALVDVAWRDAGRTEPKIGERGLYVLTAKIVRWEPETTVRK